MLVQIVTENGQKKIKPLTADAGAGNPVGTIIPMYKKSSPSGYLYCDGSTFDAAQYPLLYAYLGSNVLPDYRECAIVGAEQNTTDTIANHDVYTQGQFKDDQLQNHGHSITDPGHIHRSPYSTYIKEFGSAGSFSRVQGIGYNEQETLTITNAKTGITIGNPNSGRHGDVTRGKRKAVYFYIKATSGLSENAQDNVVAQLNEERSYSTEEVNTGKKWIDGKPIYRKVFYSDTNFDGNTTVGTITNLNRLIDIKGFIQAVNNGQYPCYTDSVNVWQIYVNSSGAINRILTGGAFTNSRNPAYVIVEYTKTTD
jgi:hypothetical protein